MQYDRFGTDVAARFTLFLSTISNDYLARVSAGQALAQTGDFRNTGYQALIALQNDVRTLISKYEQELVYGAPPEPANAFMQYLTSIAMQSLNTLIVKLGGGGVLREADLLNRPAGAIGAILARRASVPRHTARDSAGRAWVAEKLVQTIARDFAYQATVEHDLYTLQRAGDVHVDIVYADSTRNYTTTVKEAIEKRSTIFHPNASAKMQRHYVQS